MVVNSNGFYLTQISIILKDTVPMRVSSIHSPCPRKTASTPWCSSSQRSTSRSHTRRYSMSSLEARLLLRIQISSDKFTQEQCLMILLASSPLRTASSTLRYNFLFISHNTFFYHSSLQDTEAPSAIKNGKLQLDFAVGRSDNPKVNAILIVEGGIQNTHYQAHERYVKELEKIRKMQQNQQQQEAYPSDSNSAAPFSSSFDFFADDEDLSQPKGMFNSVLDQNWVLEITSVGVLVLFFTLLKLLSSENENLPVGLSKDHKKKRQ